jgi:hypothetical protein
VLVYTIDSVFEPSAWLDAPYARTVDSSFAVNRAGESARVSRLKALIASVVNASWPLRNSACGQAERRSALADKSNLAQRRR